MEAVVEFSEAVSEIKSVIKIEPSLSNGTGYTAGDACGNFWSSLLRMSINGRRGAPFYTRYPRIICYHV